MSANKAWEEPKNNMATATAPSLLDRIVEHQQEVASRYKPVMSIQDLIDREKSVQYLVSNLMEEGIDYGWIPGTKPKDAAKPGEYSAKPTLFKAGAERACAFFGYVPKFHPQEVIECWTSDKYGEMLFYYRYECTLRKDGAEIGSGIGSATTWESKYRYRNSERTCPECGKANIRKSKPKPGQRGEPGFYCWDKTGGCGATFAADNEAIVGQEVGKTPNPDVADVVNTVQKMAQKRAYVAATLTATGLSGRFTQDLEDLPAPRQSQPAEEPKPAEVTPQANGKHNLTFAERVAEFAVMKARKGTAAYYEVLGGNGYEHANQVCKADVSTQRRIYRELAALPDDDPDTAREPEEGK